MRHIISILVENEFGVLARVAGLFSGRGFNIESLSVAETLDPTVSRITLVTRGDDQVLEQMEKQLNKLICVIKVGDFTATEHVERELVLIKVRADERTRGELANIVDIFRAKIIDVSRESYIVEITGAEEKVNALVELLKPIGILDIVLMLVPDEQGGEIYEGEIAPGLKPGKSLAFGHGFNIHYKKIVPPAGVNVFMVAPKGPGHLVRSEYQKGRGVPCLLAVAQDPSGDTKQIGLAYAKAIGGTRAGVLETSFKEETETDLFGEQSVLCGGLTELIRAGFETLVEAGYSPEMAYFECLHEVKLIVDLIYEGGLQNMRYSISNTAEYGDMTRGKKVVGPEVRKAMKQVLADIQSGTFADEWVTESRCGSPHFRELRKEAAKHPVEEVGTRLRALMPWLASNRLVDRSRN